MLKDKSSSAIVAVSDIAAGEAREMQASLEADSGYVPPADDPEENR